MQLSSFFFPSFLKSYPGMGRGGLTVKNIVVFFRVHDKAFAIGVDPEPFVGVL